MKRGVIWHARAAAASAALACILSLRCIFPQPAPAVEALFVALTIVGWGHLVTPLGSAATAGVVVAAASAGAIAIAAILYFELLAAWPAAAWFAVLALSAWHFVENDVRLASLTRGVRKDLTRHESLAIVFASTLLLAAFLGLASPGSSEPKRIQAELLTFWGMYHVLCWTLLLWSRASEVSRSGQLARGRKKRRLLVASHLVPLAIGGVLLAAAPRDCALRELFFSPAVYLFASGLHVVQTGWCKPRRHA